MARLAECDRVCVRPQYAEMVLAFVLVPRTAGVGRMDALFHSTEAARLAMAQAFVSVNLRQIRASSRIYAARYRAQPILQRAVALPW